MISIDVLSCPGQLRHICPRWLKLENPPKISQCTPEKFHNIRNKQEAIPNTPPENPSNVSLFFFQNSSNSIMTYCHQKQQHIKSKSKNLRITQSSLGTWYASWASRVAVSMLKIMSFTCEGKVITLGASPPLPFSLRWCGWPWPIRFNQWRNRTTPKQTNRHSTYKGMLKMQ